MRRNRALGWATVSILKALRHGHRFGLDIMERTGLPSGTVYPTLTRLEAREFVTSTWEDSGTARAAGRPRRRYYEVTPEGATALDEALARLEMLTGGADASVAPEGA